MDKELAKTHYEHIKELKSVSTTWMLTLVGLIAVGLIYHAERIDSSLGPLNESVNKLTKSVDDLRFLFINHKHSK